MDIPLTKKCIIFRAGAETTLQHNRTRSWHPSPRPTMTSAASLPPTISSWLRVHSPGGPPGCWNREFYTHLTTPNTLIYSIISILIRTIQGYGGITRELIYIQNTGLGTPITLWIPKGKFCAHQQMWRHVSSISVVLPFFLRSSCFLTVIFLFFFALSVCIPLSAWFVSEMFIILVNFRLGNLLILSK